MSTEKIMEQPVNVRLLEALKGLMALSDHRVDLRDQAKAARSAIAEAEAQQERLLQDMHDAGREIDRMLAEPQPDADNPWKSAVIDQLVIAHILTAEHESYPLKAVQDLLAYHTDIAVDPRVSGAAAELVEQANAEEREACAKVCDELFPPPSEQMTVEWAAGTVACANAIRARGQK